MSGALLAAVLLLGGAPLEGAEHLSRFFARLGQPAARVRVTHFGDSHIVADLLSGVVREGLQARFGDGGRGLVLAGRPWRSYGQQHLINRSHGEWRVDGLRGGLDDGWFGAGLCASATADPDAFFEVGPRPGAEAGQALAAVDVHYLRQPRGGCFEVRADGVRVGRARTAGPWVGAGFARFELPPGARRISVHALGDAEVRVFGASLEGAGGGLIYDAIGLNGARVSRLLRLAPGLLPAALGRLRPDLVILSFGTNELFDDHLDLGEYAKVFAAALERVRAAPTADCLVTGPPDAMRRRRPLPLHDAMVELQRTLEDAHGCAFWDARAAMGGAGAILEWRRRGRAGGDLVHLTRDGYAELGGALLEALLGAYGASTR